MVNTPPPQTTLASPQIRLKDFFTYLISELEALDQKIIDAEITKDDSQARQKARSSIDIIKKSFEKTIQEYQENEEWDTFTIALYGETNAGKSTLIEGLRILFGEKTKIDQQEKFASLLKERDDKLRENSDELKNIEQENEIKLKEASKSSLLNRFLAMFFQSFQEKIKKEQQERLILVEEETNKKIQENNDQAKQIKEKYEKALNEVADGGIIGIGRSDTTREVTTYSFSCNGQNFALLDVPGIEGKEAEVIKEIERATKKAHAVFYITPESKPPQSGTLEKVKNHLGAQTEVYAIFNKRINSLEQIENLTELVAENEKEGLEELDQKMKDALEDHYAGHHALSAQIAFLAIAKNLTPNSRLERQRNKFLEKLSKEEILEKSYYEHFTHFLTRELINNTKQKIEASNTNKARNVLQECKSLLEEISNNYFGKSYQEVSQRAEEAETKLHHILETSKRAIKNKITDAIKKFTSEIRDRMYKEIDRDISNDQLKEKLQEEIRAEQENLKENIAMPIQEEIKELENEIKKVEQDFTEKAKRSIKKSTIDLNLGRIALDLDAKSGFEWGMLASLGGVGLSGYFVFTLVNAWNPVGWTLMAGAVAGLLASIWAVFKDFFKFGFKKKPKQKNATDKALGKVEEEVQKEIEKKQKELFKNLKGGINECSEQMKRCSDQFKTLKEHVDASIREIEALEKRYLI